MLTRTDLEELKVQTRILEGIIDSSKDSVPWLKIGNSRTFLPYQFLKDIALDLPPGLFETTARKLQLDYAILYLGLKPDYPLLREYKYENEVLEIKDKWKLISTYKKYDYCPKTPSSQSKRTKNSYLNFRQYACCEISSLDAKRLKSELGRKFEWSCVIRYLLSERAIREWGAKAI